MNISEIITTFTEKLIKVIRTFIESIRDLVGAVSV